MIESVRLIWPDASVDILFMEILLPFASGLDLLARRELRTPGGPLTV